MGMGGVEIAMAVEDAFSITLDDAEATKILTPRQLIAAVQSKVAMASATVCLTQRAFNLLRKSLICHGGWKRSEINPGTCLPMLLPKNQRREFVHKVITDLGIKQPPEYVRAGWVNGLLFLGPTLTGAMVAFATGQAIHTLGIWIFIGVTLLTASLAWRLTQPLCTEFPKPLQTVGGLARWVMTHKADLAHATVPGWTREQIAIRVHDIVVEVLDCDAKYHEDARLVEDLGLG